MQPLDIWQVPGTPQVAEITALVSLALPLIFKTHKSRSIPTSPTHFKK